MKRVTTALGAGFVLALTASSLGGKLLNTGFEEEFGPREDRNMWGDYGETFGECYQVEAGKDGHPHKAHEGSRMLLINIPPNTWNGIWQQMAWPEKASFTIRAYYMIRRGSLPDTYATFLKAEFFDLKDQKLGELAGEQRRADTAGRWILDTLRGTTPARTASIRVVIIGGNNPDGPTVENRIYWDDASLTQ